MHGRCMRTTRDTLAVLVFVLVLVSLYWNYKLLSSKTRTQTKVTEDALVSGEVKKQISIHVEDAATTDSISTTGSGSMRSTLKSQVLASTSQPQDTKYYLMQRLLQLEAKLNLSQEISRILFIGSPNVLNAEVPLYKPCLKQHGFVVEMLSEIYINNTELSQWSGLMCYTHSGPRKLTCLSKERHAKLKLHQKVSSIPGLVKVLFPLEKFCYTMSQTHHIPVFSSSPLSIPCYVLPSKPNLLKKLLESTENTTLLLIRTHHHGSYYYTFFKKESIEERLLQDKSVLQVINHPLLARGLPVIIKLYVIITSVSPLRIYKHLDGEAAIMTLDKGIKESWTLDKFGVYLSKLHSNHDVIRAWSRVDDVIVNTLMISESILSSHDVNSSNNGFQLLEFHFTFNSSLHPFVLEVKVPAPGSTLPSVANDTVHLVFSATSSSSHVTDTLEKLKNIIGVESVTCRKEHSICLSEQEMVYLLESHREVSTDGRFKKLYPTHDGRKYQPLLDVLQSSVDTLRVGMATQHQRGTLELHVTLLLMENYGYQGTGFDNDDTLNIDQRKEYWETDDDDYPDKVAAEARPASRNPLDNCKDDPSLVPVLTDILIKPSSQLSPSFNSQILEYEVVFPFEVMVVRVWGTTSTCRSEARVNSKVKTSQEPINYSLGVGWNKFAIHLINTSPHPPHPSVVSSYTVNIYRRTRSDDKSSFDTSSPHEMCAVQQDCDLQAFPHKPCGPQTIPEKSFEEFRASRDNWPLCKSGDVPGSWVLPCVKCSQPNSCYWNKAIWTPQSCQHRQLTTKETKTCLTKKKILFVGDSTNRGMMYYLMEKINGSLQQWEKTHSMKVYSSALNDDHTSVSFAYYPQFWLPSGRKPVFLKALHHLMARFMPLENSTNTILVVGGVQWLLPSHVTAIKSTLHSLGLSGIKVLVKSLGCGFHLPVPGFVQLNLQGHLRVSQRNQLVIKTARAAGFEVVDTYAMTVARYKEFLMGKCGCHFHKVVDMKSPTREHDGGFESVLDTTEGYSSPRYHVIGPINSAYADIMISRMCS